VQFKVDGANLGSPVGLSGGQAQANTTSLAVGTRVITAEYAGSTNFTGSTGTLAGGQVVNKAATTASISSDTPDPSVTGQQVTVNYGVSVTAPGAGTPTGNVTVSDGAGTQCVGSVGAGTCNLTFATTGAKTLTATYAGDPNFLASAASPGVSHTVNTTTTTGLASLVNPSVFGQSVNFTATVTSGDGSTPTGTVQFQVDGGNFGSSVALNGSGQATSGATTSLAVGPHPVQAIYTPTGNFLASNGTLAGGQDVDPANTTTTITSDLSTATAIGEPYTVAVSVVADAPGSGTPGGTVTVSDGTGATCDVTLSGGTGSCDLTSTTAGTKSVTGMYVATTNFATSTSNAVSHTVNAFGAPDHYVVGVSTTTPTAGGDVTVTAQLTDQFGNPVLTSGVEVAWTSTNGGAFSSSTSMTNASGVATVTFTTSATPGTEHVVTATDGSSRTGDGPTITTQP
jgi:hypothetical protein